ncbi:hypothetical protein YWIDRAFT_07459 [Streptomyces sp. SceaMP-e96]|uniref:hypothetical protein n=1 Tax=unclassified Streptomyces TaxID=2593676 RepID=UPI000823BBF2|nr:MULTISPECIES: hypothetical protein [unclassified Streptomyces]MYT17823.1 hypothetical protein [Streptomyces sp. SID4951]SCK47118.1 hypothetical protein YWIDRAFT_07459 [Streptomyces sp. SceaMP-e96]
MSALDASSGPFPSSARSERLAQSPAVRRDGRWWLVTVSGSVAVADPVFAGQLNRFATAMAAADQAVAGRRLQQDQPGGRRR